MSGFASMYKGHSKEAELLYLAGGDKLIKGRDEDQKQKQSQNHTLDGKQFSGTCCSSCSSSSNESFDRLSGPIAEGTKNETESSSFKESVTTIHTNFRDIEDVPSALDTLVEVHHLYREKIEWIEDNFPLAWHICPNSKAKIKVYELWVEDLREQNEALCDIIKELGEGQQRQVEVFNLKLGRARRLLHDLETLVKSLTKELDLSRSSDKKLQEKYESIGSFQSANRVLEGKLHTVTKERDGLVQLLQRLRDDSRWNVEGLEFSPEVQTTLFGDHPSLPGSKIVPDSAPAQPLQLSLSPSSSSSSGTCLLQKKCAELEIWKTRERFQNPNQNNLEKKMSEEGILQVQEFSLSRQLADLRQSLVRCQTENEKIQEENKVLQEACSRERLLRKHFYNLVEEMRGQIRVYCRIRPFDVENRASKIKAAVQVIDRYTVGVETGRGLKEFQFDRIFGPSDSQQTVFDEAKSLIQSVFDGFNVCIFAYGQTGAGKTHTIMGSPGDPGILLRSLQQLFQLSRKNSQDESSRTVISLYAVELYKQKLIDLLTLSTPAVPVPEVDPSGTNLSPPIFGPPDQNPNFADPVEKLEIKRDPDGTVYVQGARTIILENMESLEEILPNLFERRHVAETQMNQQSSRSHLVIGIGVETMCVVNGRVTRGKLSLVDLAGSERNGIFVTGSTSLLDESKAINKSLSALEHVIVSLTLDQAHVPYRNNKLTELMQDSIGGSAKTLMIVNISPRVDNLDETIVSLNYGARVKQVVNKKASRNVQTTNTNTNLGQSKFSTPDSAGRNPGESSGKKTPAAFKDPPTPRSSSSIAPRKSELWTPRSKKWREMQSKAARENKNLKNWYKILIFMRERKFKFKKKFNLEISNFEVYQRRCGTKMETV